ncbi:MAG: restriction endonuclease subunit S [Algoriphagus aquaeductus]|uniref:restriction endonuclease subunit S n=1 Tax=Algoriphagus aquaeductus TaxID=475299 RepID=UPI003879C196
MIFQLNEVCEFINGGAWSDKEYVDKGIPVLKVSNMQNDGFDLSTLNYIPESSRAKYQKHILKKHDLVIATVGSHPSLVNSAAGRTSIISKTVTGFLLNQNALCLRTKDDDLVDQKFLGYLGKTSFFQYFIQQRGRGAANQMRIAISSIKEFEFDFPKVQTQRRIAFILSAYDDLIENNLRRIKLLEELAQRTYEEWFVRFRFPGFEASNINSDWLPEGWERKKLGEVLELVYGKALKADERDGGRFPVFGSSGIVGGHSKAIAKGPGVILGRKGNVGSVFWSDTDFFPIDTVYYVNSDLSKYFIFYLLKSITFINNDAAVPGLNRNAAYMMESIIPSEKVISKFDDFVTSLFSQIEKLNNQNRLLKESRDILLPRLMSGEITLSESGFSGF